MTLGSGFVGSAKADLLGSDSPWLESEFAAVPFHGQRGGTESNEVRILIVRYHHRIDLLDPDVDWSMAEYEECRLSGLGF